MILGWQENLPSDDMPPSWMWPFDDPLERWFDDLKAKREMGLPDTDSDGEETMMSNELASRYRE